MTKLVFIVNNDIAVTKITVVNKNSLGPAKCPHQFTSSARVIEKINGFSIYV